ncbi:MAG: GHKL domain-containing protein [Blautia sp.]|nr:GHKL domain-containing protein [Blautia sp.]
MGGLSRLSFTAYPLQILAASAMFLLPYPRRTHSILRLLPFTACSMVLGYFMFSDYPGQLTAFALLLGIIGFTLMGMFMAFDISFLEALSGTASGVSLQHISYHLVHVILFFRPDIPFTVWHELSFSLILTALTWLLFKERLKQVSRYPRQDPRLVIASVVSVLICIGLSRITRLSRDYSSVLRLSVSLYSITCCVMALFMRFYLSCLAQMEMEKALSERIREEQAKQYDISKEAADRLHIIHHDLRHKLTALEQKLPEKELASMRQALDTYGAVYETGEKALDVVLGEKGLTAQSKGVTMTFLGNGKDLSFMDEMDIYSLFGNLLENAISAAEQIEAKEKRLVSLTLERKGILRNIHVANYCKDPVPLCDDTLPATTKKAEEGFHGYGLRSVLETARKYEGNLKVWSEGEVFHAAVFLIEPQGEPGACTP